MHRVSRSVLQSSLTLVTVLLALVGPSAVAACLHPDPEEPRTLVLALDGIPYRVLEEARAQGAFQGWPETVPLISTFPSLTNVAFTGLFRPFDVDPAGGYEIKHYDWEANKVVGGSLFGYRDRLFAWRDTFDVTGRSVRGKLLLYTRPRKHSRKQLREATTALLESDRDLVLTHVGATDALVHLRGDSAALAFLLEVDQALLEVRARHQQERGRPLRLIVLSDHGNTNQKVRPVKGVKRQLRKAGLRPVARLRRSGDVVAKTFGVVSYGALFTEAGDAATAARAITAVKGIDVAAWIEREGRVRVVSSAGEATIRWRGPTGQRRYAYDLDEGDPLGYAPVVERLQQDDRLDGAGFASETTWFQATFEHAHPDGLRRLVRALRAEQLTNPATVIFSTHPGYAWGLRSAHLSSRLAGGRLEATHGGLDRESSLAFFLTDDPTWNAPEVLDLESALVALTELGQCVNRANVRAEEEN